MGGAGWDIRRSSSRMLSSEILGAVPNPSLFRSPNDLDWGASCCSSRGETEEGGGGVCILGECGCLCCFPFTRTHRRCSINETPAIESPRCGHLHIRCVCVLVFCLKMNAEVKKPNKFGVRESDTALVTQQYVTSSGMFFFVIHKTFTESVNSSWINFSSSCVRFSPGQCARGSQPISSVGHRNFPCQESCREREP